MDKQSAVAGLGETALLQPARVRQALKANDRLKVYLGLLQAAAAHARAPDQAPQDLSPEIAAADIQPRDEAAWLREMPASASLRGDMLQLPQWLRLAGHLDDDLHALACPVLGECGCRPRNRPACRALEPGAARQRDRRAGAGAGVQAVPRDSARAATACICW